MITSQNPLVSVIIPNYCHAKYLDQRIQSILNQTFQDFEIIILDDKSTDNSVEIINKYKNNPHVHKIILNKENSGNTFLQWNKGIREANGKIIWIAESDDYCEPTLLEELIKAYFHAPNTVIAYSTSMTVNEKGVSQLPIIKHPNQYLKGKDYIKRYLSLEAFIWNASSAIFNKDKALSIAPLYMKYKGAGDYMFWTELSELGNVAIVNKQLNYFRRHDDVITNKRDADGSNYLAGREILNYMTEKIRFSWLRKRYVMAYHARKLQHKTFNTDNIRKEVWDIWEIGKYQTSFDKFLFKVGNYLIYHFHYYI